MAQINDILEILKYLTQSEADEVAKLIDEDLSQVIWRPIPGPQTMAYNSVADIIGYGGAAGGGKTDLMCGMALTKHRKAMILRRVGTELTGIVDRIEELLGTKDGYSDKRKIWRPPGRSVQIELGALPDLGDEKKFQGRPHDFLAFDEATNFFASQVRFLLTWLRTTVPGQPCRMLLGFNPPVSPDGRWVIPFFAPWLDKKFPNPAKFGELRYAASMPADDLHPNGRDLWVERPDSFVIGTDGHPLYDFDPEYYSPDDIIKPLTRTFIPSRVTDNPYLMATGYISTLQSLPEPLRSQMLKGDFEAGTEDDPWQVIPTQWVAAAQSRWTRPSKLPAMDSLGVDVARGGADSSVIARRHDQWYDEPLTYPGSQTPNGPSVAGLVISSRRDRAPVHIDVIGVGSSAYDFLVDAGLQTVGVNVSESATRTDKSGRLRFFNLRSQLWWMMREALDPQNNTGIALPPAQRLLSELCAPTWTLRGGKIYVQSREEIIAKTGASPDLASAYILAQIDTQRAGVEIHGSEQTYDPYKKI